ncbi:glycosyltransferase family 4 protein [Aquabacterium sp. J223]|uniref:glycosyltransferase family 4 protein n=1 Tax=Aquabacterium sp. J223 TaxID=2898431 RepID=UPI0021ADCE69|nr:glycosyltransferase family 4 protein [Aquabacterium sp. J223]UUX96853.1 glycosyltransferase family 4 protein [Aquabacterium sp. J223]
MKITFILPTPNMSGGVRVAGIYADYLVDKGHHVTMVYPPRNVGLAGKFWHRFWNRTVSTTHLDKCKAIQRVLETPRAVSASDVPDGDVVIATWWETAEWVAKLPPIKGAKVYFIQHHEIFSWLPVERAQKTYLLPMKKIVVARWLKDVMRDVYGDDEVELVPNGVDHNLFFAPERGKQAQPTVGFLYAGAHFKGVDVTLRAISLLRDRLPSLKVVSFGSEPFKDAKTRQIEFTLNPQQEKLRECYAACDVWLTASRSEGFNLPALEAMACRTPVVSTRTGWPEEAILPGVNGWLVDVDDHVGLYKAAANVLAQPDESWKMLSDAAYQTAAGCSWNRSSALFERILVDVATENAAAFNSKNADHHF